VVFLRNCGVVVVVVGVFLGTMEMLLLYVLFLRNYRVVDVVCVIS